MYVYFFTYILYLFAHTYPYLLMYIQIGIDTDRDTDRHALPHVCVCVCANIYIYVVICIYIYLFMEMDTCTYIYIYLYIYIYTLYTYIYIYIEAGVNIRTQNGSSLPGHDAGPCTRSLRPAWPPRCSAAAPRFRSVFRVLAREVARVKGFSLKSSVERLKTQLGTKLYCRTAALQSYLLPFNDSKPLS